MCMHIVQRPVGWAVTGMLCLLHCLPAQAQVTPTIIQQLNFGTFSTGQGGGSITVNADGMTTTTGDVIQIGRGGMATPAVIELQAPVGSRIAILETNSLLKGSNGNTMSLRIKGSDPVMPFITKTPRTNIHIGGTLTVNKSGQTASGKYNGQVFITFLAGE
ncbi:DUF4402 domain-containing protein [Chitinophaga qingshengii]|uniref:DUF4402 domain-containing protein n=1 Tax=Chitinophaga qingshengii TaxID=1569794 RepID=A0ABR7TGT6_9BACT|nr:DUF4402 domain-containing protein [Chitinophaga qingshengii]MBC9929175.1 DUF4402 domain-containing protein [Chitinophaga qingshengii]